MPSSRDEIQRQIQQEPMECRSAHHYEWLVAVARRSHRTIEAVPVVVDAVRQAEMNVGYTHFDELLK